MAKETKERKDKSTTDPKPAKPTIPRVNMQVAAFKIRGIAPYVGHKFSAKARAKMRADQEAGNQQTKKRGAKQPKDFERLFQEATHRMPDGTPGLPASAFRAAMISACRLVGFKMTLAKLAVFVEQDDFDIDDDTPLVRIDQEPEYSEHLVKNETGVADIRPRPRWREGWTATVRVRYDADTFTAADIRALLERVGLQVGIGEGRPDSRKSTGMGWGLFEVTPVES